MNQPALLCYTTEGAASNDIVACKNLSKGPTVEILCTPIQPVHPDDEAIKVFEIFLKDRSYYALPVVQDQHPTGLINRNRLIERFCKPYARELLGRRPVRDFMDPSPIIVEKHEGIDDIARIIIDAGMQYMHDGFIITDRGRYIGMGLGRDLLDEITHRSQEDLFCLAHYDFLTGLPNRLLFNDRLSRACSQAERERSLIALLFIDLDGFKVVNDELGHPVGDLLLKAVAGRLMTCLRNSDSMARLGGDEFTIILDDIKSEQDAAIVAHKVIHLMAETFDLGGHEIHISASVGIALYPLDASRPEFLIKRADLAMYHAKEMGKNNFQFYSEGMNARQSARIAKESLLRRAIVSNELRIHYQPLIELSSGKVMAVEALLRWMHPELGMIPPADFIPLAEDTGLIVPIGEEVLRTACRQNREWQSAGLPPMRVAVNISARQIKQLDFSEMVARILGETALEAQWLELEITENMLLDHAERTIETLSRLAQMGIHLSIDDFGTGYSSLSYLKRLPLHTLKIDKSFVGGLPEDRDDAAITTAIIAMAHRLGLKVVAEGLESREQVEFLRHHRCDIAQGYHFSRPLPPEEIPALLVKAYAMPGSDAPHPAPEPMCLHEQPEEVMLFLRDESFA